MYIWRRRQVYIVLKRTGNKHIHKTSTPEKALLNNVLTHANIYRLRLIAWLLIAFMSILIVLQLVFIAKVVLPRALEIAPYIMHLRFIFIGGSVAFLIVSGRPASPNAITRRHYIYSYGYILFNLTGFAILSGLIQSIGPGIASSYLMAMIISSAFLYLNLPNSVLIYSLAWAVMSIMVWRFQFDWLVASSVFLNSSFVTIIAIFISYTVYTNRVREFLYQRKIERQKEKLLLSNDMLKNLSYLDALTGIPNRRFFDEFLRREWKRAVREQQPLCMIMIDIDHFKLFNDTFGHQNGDDALFQVGTTLNMAVKRPGDLVFRYGGEEFAAILPKTDQTGVTEVAKRMLQAVSGLKIYHPFSPTGRLTISVGLACVQPKNGELPDYVIDCADKALYRAKGAGGNQYVRA